MQALLLASCALLARAGPALAGDYVVTPCSVNFIGTLEDLTAEHTEMLRPGQHVVSFTIPPVCDNYTGVRVVACDPTADPPKLELRDREVMVERRGDAVGFGEFTVTVYCTKTDVPVSPKFRLAVLPPDTLATALKEDQPVPPVLPAAGRSAVPPPKPSKVPLPIPLSLSPSVLSVESQARPLDAMQFSVEASLY